MGTTVVGAVVVRDGAVLAARRTQPPELAGRWELPGGKVEPGESEQAALARELHEELWLPVRVGPLIGRVDLDADRELAVYRCAARGEPDLGDDHDKVRWLVRAELSTVRWLDADRALLPVITAHLTHARIVAGRLLLGAVAAFVLALIGVLIGIHIAQQPHVSCGSDIDALIKLVCTDTTYPHARLGLIIAVASAFVGGGAGVACLVRRRHLT